ncbi:MAG: hypothetical protein Q7R95_01950 [bacterium]|nr:hypothetical protein [bacterium]
MKKRAKAVQVESRVGKVLGMMKTGKSREVVGGYYVEGFSSRVLSGTIYGHKALQYNTNL